LSKEWALLMIRVVYYDSLWYWRGVQVGRFQCTAVRLKGNPEGTISWKICMIEGESRMAESDGYCIVLTEIVWLRMDHT
jgi:hypothetical protein